MPKESIVVLFAGLILLAATSNLQAQEVRNLSAPESFRERLESVTSAYLDLEQQIRAAAVDRARTKANAITVYLDEMSDPELRGEKRADWISTRLNLLKLLNDITNASNISQQRKVFNELSRKLLNSLKRFGPVYMNLYGFKCPDVLEAGGYWIDATTSSVNPYDTEETGCARLEEQISAKNSE